LARILQSKYRAHEIFGNCKDLGRTPAGIQARLPAQLGGRCDAAACTGRHRASDSDSPFHPRPNYTSPSGLYSLPGRKLSSVLAALLFAASGAAQATIINARSPSFDDVSTAVRSAANGDTVVIPAGMASWTKTLVITKGITLQGQTTTDPVEGTADDKTIIQDNVTRRGGGTPLIDVQSVSGQTYRISGITFQPYSGMTQNNSSGAVKLRGNSHAVRLDHCHFQPMPEQSIYVGVWGAIYGVADHNVMECPHIQSFVINMGNWPNPDGSAGQWGDGSWTAPTSLGSEKFFFIEDNYIKNITGTPAFPTWSEGGGNVDCTWGGRWVFRHNHCYETQMNGHGTEGGRYRGCRAREIYNNDFHYAHAHGAGGSRSGVTIIYDNTWDGVQPTKGLVLGAARVATSSPSWGGGSGDNPWDVNDTRNGPFTEGGFSYSPVNGLYESGIAETGTNKTIIVDTTKHWAANQWVNFVVKRVANNTIALITSNTSDALTVYYGASGRSQANWTAGDHYQIRQPLILLDQPGRGQGDLMTGTRTTPINRTTGKATWPHNALEPTYSWNNKYTPTGASVDLKAGPGNINVQQEGRDYYNNTPMPSYTPYVYPHPLTKATAKPSQASKKS
jgi:hypothetical protein